MMKVHDKVTMPSSEDIEYYQYAGILQPGVETIYLYKDREPRFYANLGFTRVGGDESGRTTWILRLDDGWTPFPTFITEAHRDGIDPH